MGIWKTIKAAFGTAVPPDARRLNAVDVFALSASLGALLDGERGWITLSEARDLFSTMDDQYAFGEMDEIGRANLVAFAAQSEHRSSFDLQRQFIGRWFRRDRATCQRTTRHCGVRSSIHLGIPKSMLTY